MLVLRISESNKVVNKKEIYLCFVKRNGIIKVNFFGIWWMIIVIKKGMVELLWFIKVVFNVNLLGILWINIVKERKRKVCYVCWFFLCIIGWW